MEWKPDLLRTRLDASCLDFASFTTLRCVEWSRQGTFLSP